MKATKRKRRLPKNRFGVYWCFSDERYKVYEDGMLPSDGDVYHYAVLSYNGAATKALGQNIAQGLSEFGDAYKQNGHKDNG